MRPQSSQTSKSRSIKHQLNCWPAQMAFIVHFAGSLEQRGKGETLLQDKRKPLSQIEEAAKVRTLLELLSDSWMYVPA